MNNVVFARTRQHYQPYEDLFWVAILSGFEVHYLDELNWSDPTLTVICPVKHPEWNAIPADKRARLIWWTFERGIADAPPMDMASPYIPPCVDEVWASDRAYARYIRAKYVFLGGNRAFGAISTDQKEYDIITMMYWSGRRQRYREQLKPFTCADLDGGMWNEARHQRLIHSKLMVSIHQDDKAWCEPIRFMIAGCYALPIVSEYCEDAGYWRDGLNFSAAPVEQVADLAQAMLDRPTTAARMGAAAWKLVCQERPFRQEVMAAL